MPIKKSAKKYVRVTARKKARNLAWAKKVKTAIKNVRKAVKEKSEDSAQKALLAAQKAIDKAESKKILKKNTAARKKSRLAKAVQGIKKS